MALPTAVRDASGTGSGRATGLVGSADHQAFKTRMTGSGPDGRSASKGDRPQPVSSRRPARTNFRISAVAHPLSHCIVWTGNRRVRKHLTLEQYLALSHAVTRYGFDRRPGYEQYTLERLGVKRRVELSCTTPALLGPLIVGTQRIATVPTRLAQQQEKSRPLRLLAPPLDLPPLRSGTAHARATVPRAGCAM